ncbi:MAG: protein translocase subunit SecD [Kordiimonas sp.]|nr:protein translocase subunit SecD [Kordiimonas sp.]
MLYFSPWKTATVIVVCLLGILLAFPNFISREQAENLPSFLPKSQINLGLDLQGGAHLLLEVDINSVMQDRLEVVRDTVRSALREKRIGYTGGLRIKDNTIHVKVRKSDQIEAAEAAIEDLAVFVGGTMSSPGAKDLIVDREGRDISVRLSEVAMTERKRMAVSQSIEIVRRRIDEMGTREPTIQRQGDDRILVQVPGIENPDKLKEILGKTAKLEFRMVDMKTSLTDAERGRVPPGSELLPSADPSDDVPQWVVYKRIVISGENLVDAQPSFQNNEPVVSFRFDNVGAKRFADVTRKNVGKPFAIVLDNKVISAPRINEPIMGGSGIISGNFTIESANELSILLRAGALPAPLTILEERTVGPDLGADSVAAGKMAAIIGFIGIMIYIVLSYGPLFGMAANTALIINLFLIFGVLSFLQATLTLPGIAGIVLTIGMAVDANVLIFERIKEEVRTGKGPLAALDAGYKKAFGTILDANITTLIAAAILFQLGSGPVKGFAVTLAVGIVTSVFTAVVVTRLMLSIWARRSRPTQISL